MPPERLVEEVIWPARQVKEGYSLLQVPLTDGSVATGYARATRDQGSLPFQDIVSGEMQKTYRDQISNTHSSKNAIPPALIAQLSSPKLRDLIRYLLDRGKQNG